MDQVQNEPKYLPSNYPGMKMSSVEQANFIANSLGPKLKNAGINTKIIAYDHNLDDVRYPSEVTSRAKNFVAGAGFHHYVGTEDALLKTFLSSELNP